MRKVWWENVKLWAVVHLAANFAIPRPPLTKRSLNCWTKRYARICAWAEKPLCSLTSPFGFPSLFLQLKNRNWELPFFFFKQANEAGRKAKRQTATQSRKTHIVGDYRRLNLTDKRWILNANFTFSPPSATFSPLVCHVSPTVSLHSNLPTKLFYRYAVSHDRHLNPRGSQRSFHPTT